MADLALLRAGIPEGEQYDNLRWALARLADTFPDQLDEIDEARIARWVEEIDSGGGRDADGIRDDIFRFVVGSDEIQETLGVDEATAEDLIRGRNDGGRNFADLESSTPTGGAGPEPALSILQGNEMKWYKDGDTWYVEYGLPGSDRSIFFEADSGQMDALFGSGVRPSDYSNASFSNLSRRSGVTFGGSIAEVQGEGSWEREVQKTIDLALDEGRLPTWLEGTPEVLDIIYTAQAEGKSMEWTLQQISSTRAFKERFGGLEAYVADNNLTLEEGIDDFLGYERGLKQLERQFGGNPDRIVPAQVGDLMNRGYTLEQVTEVYGRFNHMRKNADSLNAFNAVLTANDMEALTLQGAYDFMRGLAPQDMYDIWEASSISEIAVTGGFSEYLDPSTALDYAYSTPGMLDAAQVNQMAQRAAADLLRFRHELDLGRFRLTHEDLVDVAFGMAPRSGASLMDVTSATMRAAEEAQQVLRNRSFAPFRDFNSPGQPAQSLNTRPTR